MQVLPGGASEDLSPNADPNLGPASFPEGELHLAFQDSSPNPPGDNPFQYAVAHSLLSQPTGKRYQLRDVGCVGECSRAIPQKAFSPDRPGNPGIGGHIIALTGFKLFFTGNRQHELDRVGIWFRDGTLHVALRDQGGGDTFGYLVDFVVIPTAGFNVKEDRERGTSRGLQTFRLPTPSRSHFLLTGWDFNFRDGDHDIRDIGVYRREDDLTVIYSANGADAPFDWRVEWAHVSPIVAAPL